MESFNLKHCSECFDETFQKKFGRSMQFKILESIFSGIKGTKKPLKYGKVRQLSNRKYWIFDDYWLLPGYWKSWIGLRKTRGFFQNLPKNEEKIVTSLFDIFKNIEVVSILLRFIDPANYGIISPPVRYALKQPPGMNYIDEYLAYLTVLRDYAAEYDFDRVADADMALWALVEKCVNQNNVKCPNFQKYQERIVEIEEEIIKKSELYNKLEDELLEVAADDVKHEEEKVQKMKAERDKYKKEVENLKKRRKIFSFDLIKLKDSDLSAEAKLIHDKRELSVDSRQKTFLAKIARHLKVHKIIWSENITSKPPSRISHICTDGELTVLYVGVNNYAAKLKVFPVECPDFTHARYFAIILSEDLKIPTILDKSSI